MFSISICLKSPLTKLSSQSEYLKLIEILYKEADTFHMFLKCPQTFNLVVHFSVKFYLKLIEILYKQAGKFCMFLKCPQTFNLVVHFSVKY